MCVTMQTAYTCMQEAMCIIDFHVKHIAQAKDLTKHMSNMHESAIQRVRTMNGDGKTYRVIGNFSLSQSHKDYKAPIRVLI